MNYSAVESHSLETTRLRERTEEEEKKGREDFELTSKKVAK